MTSSSRPSTKVTLRGKNKVGSIGEEPLGFCVDAGNGNIDGISSVIDEVVSFEPVVAPMTERRGLETDTSYPQFSLLHGGERNQPAIVEVFGVADVFGYGKRDLKRRLNSKERNLDTDYLNMLNLSLFHIFKPYRNATEGDVIAPVGIISLPISQYQKKDLVASLREKFSGARVITDGRNNTLYIYINPDKLQILPESTGGMFHSVFDPHTLKRRPDAGTGGTTLFVDIGYETTDCSLYEGMRYIQDRSVTVERAGMGNVVRSVTDYLMQTYREADENRIDVALKKVAGIAPNKKKSIEIAPGVSADITAVYDQTLAAVCKRISDRISTFYTEAITRVTLGGGGTHHMTMALRPRLMETFSLNADTVSACPEPEKANVLGGLSMLLQLAKKTAQK